MQYRCFVASLLCAVVAVARSLTPDHETVVLIFGNAPAPSLIDLHEASLLRPLCLTNLVLLQLIKVLLTLSKGASAASVIDGRCIACSCCVGNLGIPQLPGDAYAVCRLQTRPGSVTLAQFVKPSHLSKPPPPPTFKLPPPPPPGAPPSAGESASPAPAAKSQGTSVPAPEPRRNAWALPLANHRPPHAFANSHDSPRQAAHLESSASSSDNILSCESASYGTGLPCNGGNTVGRKSSSSVGGHQGSIAVAASSSPAQVTGHVGQSVTAAAAAVGVRGSSQGSDQYPQEAHHKTHIADLQARSAVSSCRH